MKIFFNFLKRFNRKVFLTKHKSIDNFEDFGYMYVITIHDGKIVQKLPFQHDHLDWMYEYFKTKWTELTMAFCDEFGNELVKISVPDWAVSKIQKLLTNERKSWKPLRIHQTALGPYGR